MQEHEGTAWDFGRPRAGYCWKSPRPRAKLLLQHGYGEYSHRYVHRHMQLIPTLTALGLDVYAFDLEGHGRTGGMRGMTDVSVAVGDHLAARRNLTADGSRIFLFGHSLGGLISAASAGRDASGLAGVVLSAPALLIEAGAVLKALAGPLGAIFPAARLTPPIAPESLSEIPEEVDAYRTDPLICLKAPPARLGASALRIAGEVSRTCSSWTAPVLIVHGEEDQATPAEGSRRFFAAASTPDKEIRLFPGRRHELLNDTGREEVRTLICSWLNQRLA